MLPCTHGFSYVFIFFSLETFLSGSSNSCPFHRATRNLSRWKTPLLALESFGYPGTHFIYELSVKLMTQLPLKLYHTFMNKFYHLSI